MLWLCLFFGFFYERAPLSGVVGFEIHDYLFAYIGNLGLVLLLFFMALIILVLRWKLTPESLAVILRSNRPRFGSIFTKGKTETRSKENTIENENDSVAFDLEERSPQLEPPEVSIPNSSKEDDKEVTMEVQEAPEEETLDSNLAQELVEKHGFFDPTLELSQYRLPALDLLKDYGETGITINQEELEINKNKIVDTLRNYKIGIAQIKATIGPTVTLYEIVPDAGIRISKIKNLEDDIALSLAALGIRIIAPIPGKGTIGIEVPNQNPSIVSMRSVIASPKFQKAEMEMSSIALGKPSVMT